MTRIALVLLAGLLASGATATTGQGGRAPWSTTVTFRASDGVPVAATLVLPVRRMAPAVILVHMQTRSRQDWRFVATRLAEAGLAALAIDLRGHGVSGSGADEPGIARSFANAVLDVEAARLYLASRPDVAGDRVGITGASMGANLAVLAAAGDAAVRSLVLLSPGLDYRGLRPEAALKKYGGRPALIIASLLDPYAARSARQLATAGSGIRELNLISEAAHGTVMLERQPDLVGVLVDWFRRTLV